MSNKVFLRAFLSGVFRKGFSQKVGVDPTKQQETFTKVAKQRTQASCTVRGPYWHMTDCDFLFFLVGQKKSSIWGSGVMML